MYSSGSNKCRLILVSSLMGCLLFLGVRGQEVQRQDREEHNSGTSTRYTSKGVLRGGGGPGLEELAAENQRLSRELRWEFGGREQRGWSLYAHVIAETIGAGGEPDSVDFALALGAWQENSGLEPSGTLSRETLYALISHLQSRRLKDRSFPPDQMLLTAPASDFYDPERPDDLRRVERRTYAAYKKMVREAAADGSLGLARTLEGDLAEGESYLKIISAYRSREYQQHLRRMSPRSGRAELAVNSPHFTGRALDLYVGGEPVSTKDDNRAIQVATPAYRWLVKNADRFGFRPYFYEPWHWEYVGVND